MTKQDKIQKNIIEQIKNGQMEKILKISKNLNEDQIIELLSYAEYEIFFKTINCTKYDEFSQLVSLLPQTMVQELVHLKKGLLFRSIIVNGTADDYTGKLDLDDFRQKLAFFMKV